MFGVKQKREEWERRLREERDELEIEFFSGGRSYFVTLSRDGTTVVRRYGGPIYSMGTPMNFPSKTVPVWRRQEPAELHDTVIDALLEGGFVEERPMPPLFPDEQPSSVRVYNSQGEQWSMSVPSRLTRQEPAIDRIARIFDKFCYEASQTASDEQIDNPDYDRWSHDQLRRFSPPKPPL